MNELGLINRRGDPSRLAAYNGKALSRTASIYGLIEYKGELHPGKHEPLITKALFDAVQAVIATLSKPRNPKFKPYAYRGFLRCGECGRLVTTETQKGHNWFAVQQVESDVLPAVPSREENPYARANQSGPLNAFLVPKLRHRLD